MELIDGRVNTVIDNGFRWETQSALAAALSHFSELETELELLGSGCNMGLMKDEVDAL
jgi:hypothetical protein